MIHCLQRKEYFQEAESTDGGAVRDQAGAGDLTADTPSGLHSSLRQGFFFSGSLEVPWASDGAERRG